VTLRLVVDSIGHRSFGPFLLVAGAITSAPVVGDVPGIPTTMGLFVLLTTSQILLRRERIWLPAWLLDRSISQRNFERLLGWLRRPARWLDSVTRPRLVALTTRPGVYTVAAAALAVGLVMPLMELIPLIANAAGVALASFGVALISRDGLLALLALLPTLGTFSVVVVALV
jgi:hypothetical protein